MASNRNRGTKQEPQHEMKVAAQSESRDMKRSPASRTAPPIDLEFDPNGQAPSPSKQFNPNLAMVAYIGENRLSNMQYDEDGAE